MPLSLSLDPVFTGKVKMPKPMPSFTEEGKWPELLVLKSSRDTEAYDRLIEYLDFEIEQCYTERSQLIDDWTTWQTDYWAEPESKEKNFPFKRAANIVIPLSAIAVEAIYARLLNTLFSTKPFWSIRPRTKEWVEAAPHFEDFLQIETEQSLDVYNFCRNTLLEIVKLGTGIGKSGYERNLRKKVSIVNGERVVEWIELNNGGTLDYVPLANFLIRLTESDPQKATWCGEEHEWTWTQIKRMVQDGRFYEDVIDNIKSYWSTREAEPSASGEYNDKIEEISHQEPAWHDIFRCQEIWISFDVDGDGIDEEIVVDFHKESRTLLSCRYNWYNDLHRPYRHAVYIPVEGRFYGIGVGKQTTAFQKLITTMHRQRIDNATLANMAQLAIKKTAGYSAGEAIFPGKMWFVNDPINDIREFKLSDTYTGVINHEEYANHYQEKLTGANETILGTPQQGTPGTATSDLTRLAEGNKKFDMILRNIRYFLGKLGEDIVANYQQFGDQDRHWTIKGENGEYIDKILKMPEQFVREGALIEITVTDSITNREVQQQQWMSLFSILSGYYDKQMQHAQFLQNAPLFIAIGEAAMKSGDYLIRRMVETFRDANINVEELLLFPRVADIIEQEHIAQAQQKVQQEQGGNNNGQSTGNTTRNGGANTRANASIGMDQLFAPIGNGSEQQNQRDVSSNGQRYSMG